MGTSPDYVARESVHEGLGFTLYRGRRGEDGWPVLLKVLQPGRALSRALDRLRREYEVGQLIECPVITHSYDLQAYREQPLLVLEDFGGNPLEHRLGVPLALEDFLTLASRLASALAELHRHDVIHKDLKPGNILVHPETGEVRFTGLGIASLFPREHRVAQPLHLIEGSLAYMSPEQTGRMNRTLDYRTDLYSLGVTLYQLLTGTLPFHAEDPVEWIHCHIARLPAPPHEVRPGIPPAVSAILLRLLAKGAEERYQSAQGLQRDLEHGLQQLQDTGRIEPFPLDQGGRTGLFRIPQRLYGREQELAVLLASFERVVARGVPELVLVSGYSGMGKSSVVLELQKPVVRERGLFLSGKFDQQRRDVPFATLVQAFRYLVRQLLTESEAQIAVWRERLQQAVGLHGQLMVDVIPELALIIGSQPPLQELAMSETQGRFHRVFQRFIGAFVREGQPLVLFLDDLQWADAGSLQLVKHLITHHDTRHLLIIGAYRDNEVSPSHPLMLALEEASGAGASLQHVHLAPLSPAHLGQLIAETVHRPLEEVEPLARLVHEKTAGNPFFAIQFLEMLHREHLIALSGSRWQWDVERIRQKRFTDNVVDLLVSRIRQLPAETQEALRVAACIGNTLETHLLATLLGVEGEQVHRDLGQAVREGLLLRAEDRYTFLHDRVQQAAYLLTPEERRGALHLRVGRLLLASTPPEQREERIFDIASQLNPGASLIEGREEREVLAELNLLAGRKARASTAYASATSYLSAGMALIDASLREARPDLDYGLRFERAQCEYLRGNFAEAERLLEALMKEPRLGTVERAQTCCVQIELFLTMGEIPRGVTSGLECLRLFGIELSPHPSEKEVARVYEELWKEMKGRQIEELVELPAMERSDIRAAMRLLASLQAPAIFADPNLFRTLSTTMALLSLRHGNTDTSVLGYVFLGMSLVSPQVARYQEGYRFGRLGYELTKRHRYLAHAARVGMVFGDVINFWVRPLRSDLEYLHEAFRSALEVGDLVFSCYLCNHIITVMLGSGTSLEEVWRESERRLDFVRKAGDPNILAILESQQRFILNMRGLTAGFSTFSGEGFDEKAFEASLPQSQMKLMVCWYYILKLQARLLSGDIDQALEAATLARELLWTTQFDYQQVDYAYYSALAMAAACTHAPLEVRRRYLEEMERQGRQLAVWAENCPENFAGKHALVAAELARLRGEAQEAMRLYEQALRAARANGFLQDEALAYELAARFYREQGFDAFAFTYLREARIRYARWGADGKVAWLDKRYPYLEEPGMVAPTATLTARSEQLDLLTVLKASQTLSGDLHLPRLLETLMHIMLEHAGAQWGCLLLARGEALSVAAEARTVEGKVQVGRTGLRGLEALPQSVLNYVRRTRESVLLDDATAEHRFAADTYVLRERPRSVLCVPILRHARLLGLLYLENDLAAGAFTPGRLAVLELLASQVAISLENALLYSDVERENAERRRVEEALRASQKQLQAIVDNSPTAIFVKDIQGRYLLVNSHLEKILHLRREDMLGRTDAGVLPASMERQVVANDKRVLEAGAAMELEEVVPMEDGEHTYLAVKFPLTDGAGVPYAVCGIATDITERKRAEVAERFLAEAGRRLMTLGYAVTLESVAELVVPELADWCLAYLPAGEEGTPVIGLAGVPPPSSEQIPVLLRAGGADAAGGLGGVWDGEGPVETAVPVAKLVEPGEALRALGVQSALQVLLLARGRRVGIVSLFSRTRRYDMTDLRLAGDLGARAALALDNARLYREAQEAVQARDEFLSVASHELKTPLTSLSLQAQRIQRLVVGEASPGPAELARMLGVFTRQLHRLSRLGEQFLDVSLIHSKQLALRLESIDLGALASEAAERIAGQLEAAGCSLELQVEGDVTGRWDRSRLEQVVLNLLTNAMKYGANNSVRVRVAGQSEAVVLSVLDQGIGISPEDQTRIFERFTRATPVRHHFSGLGLGLYITQQIVHAHGGNIRVESVLGAGATFIVVLPREPPCTR